MADRIPKKKRSRIMSRIRSKNTSLEICFKKLLNKNKITGYKMHPKMLGNPDFVFPKKKIVIFIDGDFWHGYNWKKLHKVPPKKYWQAKISRTIARDKKYTNQLKKAGWKVLRIWEHEIKKKPEEIMRKINLMRKGINERDKLIVIRKDDEIILKKSIPESALWSEKSFAKTWMNKEEDEIWKDL